MRVTDILLDRETANDESATVVAVYVQTGTKVEKDELLFDIENSKATQEVVAPEAGLLNHNLQVGDTVGFGIPIASVVLAESSEKVPAGYAAVQTQKDATSEPRHPDPDIRCDPPLRPSISEVPNSKTRFSHAAARLLSELDLTPEHFSLSFVTTQDVRALADRAEKSMPPPIVSASSQPDVLAEPVKMAGKAIGSRKRSEIDALSRGAGDTMLSVLGIAVGSIMVSRAKDDFLNGRITDLVIYEASRLMHKFPKLNSFYSDGYVFGREDVNAGLAIDDGGRLVVYGIQNSDRVTFFELSETITDAVSRYVSNELTVKELSRATFTVTDLSDSQLDFVLPLLPQGQSCIIGITHSVESGFRLYAGFDHRVTEGREVATFLGELRDRIQSFASSKPGVPPSVHCLYCDRSSTEAVLRNREKGLLKIVDREGRDALCCASCWNGW